MSHGGKWGIICPPLFAFLLSFSEGVGGGVGEQESVM